MFGKPRKIGKTIDEIEEGESLRLTESMEDSQLLIYLGLTNDANPLYIQHDYAETTEYKHPIIPSVMLMGVVTSTTSKHLPGPGSHVVNFSINFIEPVYHYETVTFDFEVVKIDKLKEIVTLSVSAVNEKDERVLDAMVMVKTPKNVDGEKNEEMSE